MQQGKLNLFRPVSKYPKVSIIIPLYVIEDRFFKDLKKFSKINYPNYEILVVCDQKVDLNVKKAKLILTGGKKTGPAEKRDLAIKKARGEICAFIDDDAYPDKNWLKNAIQHFSHPKIAAVGGPGLTPKEDGDRERLTGLVYDSYFCGGQARYRFVKGKLQFVDDYPAYNLIVKTEVLRKVGGYGTHYYGGEDTFLCLKIIKKGYLILYDPEVVVYHHRRALFIPYLKQIGNIGKHRGYFAKRFPQTSFRFWYFVPLILTIGFISMGLLSVFNPFIRNIFISLFMVFYLLAFLSVYRKNNLVDSLLAALGIISTHLIYGVNFLIGLTRTSLDR